MTNPVRHSDVLIVGSGSAGSVIAERLSADPACMVTVLEAGAGLADPALLAETRDGSRLPIGAASRLVRRYRSDLTERPARQAVIVRGATVGGSGAVNGGYFCRGLPGDFDPGLPGWRRPELLEHFRAVEADLDLSGPQHGGCGPIRVRRTREFCVGTERFIAGARDAGFSWIPDLNAFGAEAAISAGVGAVPLNIVDGVRTGPGAGYLLPALGRANLTLLTGTMATRIDIRDGRAVGIQAVGADGPVTCTADRIVLCAGAIESAHLLMLSGIGDEAVLRGAGVQLVVPLPVGRSCADHPEWVVPVDWPPTAGRPVLEAVLETAEGIEIRPYTTGFAAMVGDAQPVDPVHIGVALMRPRARGRLTLTSADARVAPRIEHRYDSEPGDVGALRGGMELVREIVGATARVGAPAWSTSQHLCGSAPMGADGDPVAVLDERCRVRGVDGLWVADGSALPRIPSRGPHATIVMLAHRAAEFVRAG